ncbi:MAG: DUF4199 domain-containing protein [Cyclobacteriaceae bacterium]|nr:DUF4199 domain-containing protein [Cyclobacteriaceae bacterium]MCX7638115.1 DUF4199 domain-containing protein [Cyclobacteriaceae bacterium]MDW8331091.1 DUF4199 domain-containing protein [Cyclobacteriaceae bacterium]
MNVLTNPNLVHINYGLRIAVGLIVYFLVMKFAGLLHVVELRLLNLFILIAGIYYALKKFQHTHGEHIHYFRALITGFATGAVGSLVFAAFLFLYVSLLDRGFMQYLIENEPMGRFLNPYIASFIVALEGVFSGLLVTFILINFIDTDEPSEG